MRLFKGMNVLHQPRFLSRSSIPRDNAILNRLVDYCLYFRIDLVGGFLGTDVKHSLDCFFQLFLSTPVDDPSFI